MDLEEIVESLQRMAAALELTGANPFKVRAYASAARTLARQDDALELIDGGRITSVRGIGKGLAGDLAAMRQEGDFAALEELEAGIPRGIFEMLRLPGLGPKRVATIWKELGTETVGELEYACLENRLKDLKGFGPAMQDKILEAVDFFARQRGLHLMHVVRELAERLAGELTRLPGVLAVATVGGVRRAKLVTRDVDLLVALERPGDLAAALILAFGTDAVRPAGDTDGGLCWSLALPDGVPVDITACEPDRWGWALVQATGATAHVQALRRRAAQAGLDPGGPGPAGAELRAPGVVLHAGKATAPPEEVALYQALGLAWVPPELREDEGEIQAAARGALPTLVTLGDLHGAWHNHTDWSDGAASLQQMAAAAAQRGWAFLGISDHSRAAFYAHGLDAARLAQQGAAIDGLDAPLAVLKGLEADILPDGSVDLAGEGLGRLDFCVASVHSLFSMEEEAMTDRVVSALAHPAVTILGHATGRLLLSREGFALDMQRVLDACAEHGVAAELNANPHRLDLDTHALRAAKARGVPIAISPDAHSLDGLDDLRYGVAAARRAGLTPDDLLVFDKEPARR